MYMCCVVAGVAAPAPLVGVVSLTGGARDSEVTVTGSLGVQRGREAAVTLQGSGCSPPPLSSPSRSCDDPHHRVSRCPTRETCTYFRPLTER